MTDVLGSTIGMVNSSGSIATKYMYEPFGVPTLSNNNVEPAYQYLFAGMEYDSPTGLYHTYARYYSPRLQRFLSEDPLGFGGGDVNLFAYALGLLLNGDILVVNGRAVAQFTSSGSLESTVTGGTIVVSNGSSAPGAPSIIQANGDYLLGQDVFTGEESRGHNSAVQVLRFDETGSTDGTFNNPPFHYVGTGGSGIEALVDGLAVQSNDDVVVVGNQVMFTQAGTTSINGLARLNPSGELDSSFGKGGIVVNSVPGSLDVVTVQPADDKIVAVGIAGSDAELIISRHLAQ